MAEARKQRLAVLAYASAFSAGGTLGNGLAMAGSSLPHNNVQPYLALNFCIALQGIYPARS